MGDFGKIYLFVILAAVYVCTLAIQGATTRLMFSMGRDGRIPFGGTWGHVSPRFKTPANAAVAVGVLAVIPFIVSDSPAVLATGATGMIYLSYFLCNLGVLVARRRGWPQKEAFFSLGNWGTVINVVALIWGGLMLINFALWQSDLFGVFGTGSYTWPDGTVIGLRDITNPLVSAVGILGVKLDFLPIPVFEFMLGVVLLFGVVYYFAVERRRIQSEAVTADAATGEALIG
jgi:amino acid transporter